MHTVSSPGSTRLALLAALALLLAGAALLWLQLADETAAAGPSRDAAASPRGDAMVADDAVAGDAPQRTRVAALADAAARCRGRMLGAWGEPLADAMIGEADAGSPGYTARDGAFEFGCTQAGSEVTVLALAAEHAPFAAVLPLRAGATDHELGDLQLRRGGALRGRVVDDAQRPVAGAAISVQSMAATAWPANVAIDPLLPAARSGADGSFVLEHLPSGTCRIGATAPGRQPARSATLTIADGAQLDVDPLVLAAGHTLTGRVVGPDDAPVAGARLRVRTATGQPGQPRVEGRAASGADGAFTIDALPPGALQLEARKEGFLTTELLGVDAQRGEPVLVRLAAGLRISGTVVDARSGAPVERFAVVATRVGSFDANANGSIEQQLQRQAEALRQQAAAASDDAARAERAAIAQQFEARAAAVRARRPALPVAIPEDPGEVRAWPGGSFSVDGLDEGVYDVGVASPEHCYARVAAVELRRDAAAPQVRVELARGFRVAGTVVEIAGGAPVGGAVVELTLVDERAPPPPATQRTLFPWLFAPSAPTGSLLARTVSAADGTFVFPQLPPGSYFFTVHHDAYADHDSPTFAVQQDVPELRAQVARRAVLHGTVTGVPAALAAEVEVLVLGGHGAQLTVKARGDGSYRFDGLQPGEYYVRAFAAGNRQYVNRFFGSLFPEHAAAIELERVPPRDVVLAAGEVRSLAVPFDVPAVGTVTGTVSLNTQPGSKARVVLRPVAGEAPAAGGLSMSATCDDRGAFGLRDVPAGRYDLAVQGPTRQELHVERVDVRAGELATVVCGAAAGALRGRVLAADGTPPAELRGYVWVLPGANAAPADLYEHRRAHRVHRLQVRDGAFEDPWLTPGRALLVVELRGRKNSVLTATVTAGGTAVVDVSAGPRDR